MISTVLAVVMVGCSEPATKPRDIILKRYEELNAFALHRDGVGVAKWFTVNAAPDFHLEAAGSSYTAKQTGEAISRQYSMLKKVSGSTFHIGNFSLHGNVASCSFSGHFVAILPGGKKLVNDSTSVDTWKLVANKSWKLASMVSTKEKTTVDGKPVGG